MLHNKITDKKWVLRILIYNAPIVIEKQVRVANAESDLVPALGGSFISQDTAHQQTIYECLNSEELRKLFESLHDEEHHVRMTAVNFVCYLLFHNFRIVESLLRKEND